MYYEVYIDTFFIINFCMDLLVLWTVYKILNQPTTWLRLISSATIGSLIICLIFIFPFKNLVLNSTITYVLTGVLMVYIAFRPRSIKEGIKLIVILYIVTFLIGGIITALYYYTKVGYYFNEFFNGNLFNLDINTFIVICAATIIIIKLVISIITRFLNIKACVYPIEIELNGLVIKAQALLDTGNNLYDPITKTPVMIAEFDAVKEVLPNNVNEILVDFMNNNTDDFYIKMAANSNFKFRLIPFNSIGKEAGMLIGIIPDKVSIDMKDNKKTLTDVVIAIYNKKLTGDNSYQMLLHPAMIK